MRIAIILALAIAFPAAAAAKEVTRVDVCGADGCTRVNDHATMEAFMQGGDMAQAGPARPQRSYLLKVYMREGTDKSHQAWTNHWLPAAGLIASEDSPGRFTFTSVGPKLERALRDAARGRQARAARRFGQKLRPVAQIDEVVPAPAAAKVSRAGDGSDGPPYLWIGVAAGLLLVGGGAARARRG
jgi:hypothetical protein